MRDIAAAAEAQIVHAPDLIAALEQAVAKMAADEASAAGDQNSHELHLIHSASSIILRQKQRSGISRTALGELVQVEAVVAS